MNNNICKRSAVCRYTTGKYLLITDGRSSERQEVIDTGLYGIVPHPMYSVTIILFLSMSLVLGSISHLSFFLYTL